MAVVTVPLSRHRTVASESWLSELRAMAAPGDRRLALIVGLNRPRLAEELYVGPATDRIATHPTGMRPTEPGTGPTGTDRTERQDRPDRATGPTGTERTDLDRPDRAAEELGQRVVRVNSSPVCTPETACYSGQF